MRKQSKKKIRVTLPRKSKDVPATMGFVWGLHQELKHELTSLKLQMASQMSKFEASIHRALALAEEQNARNIIVLDGYAQIYERQNHFDKRLGKVEKKNFV
jgi:hypothetical protein